MRANLLRCFLTLTFLVAVAKSASAQPLPQLKVSDNRRFLVTTDGKPFFWLGDTAWELFHRATREDAERYLQKRAAQRFTVIQAVALAEFDGLHAPNAYGQTPLVTDDPTRPNEEYFTHVDWIIAKANALGMYVGLLPTWGDKWNQRRGVGPEIFTPANATVYGEWLGRRYRNAGVIWILGDRPIENDTHLEIIRALARGLRSGDGGAHLITFHPSGGEGSSTWLHNEDWLDFNTPERPFTGVHRSIRQNAQRLRPLAGEAGARRRADLRRPSRLVQCETTWPFDSRRCQAGALLGSVLGRIRPHLRPSLRLANVDAAACTDQHAVDALV